MHSAIDYALTRIKLAIPKEVLEKTFLNSNQAYKSYRNAVSVDFLIKQEVIRNYVMTDANLIGANKVTVAVNNSWVERLDQGTMCVRVPKSFTQNRTIIDVESCDYLPSIGYTIPYGAQQATSDTTIAMNKLMNSYRNPVVSGTAVCEVVGENTVLIMGGVIQPMNMFLSLLVAHDSQGTSIKRSAYMKFAELCILATKAYIWANKIISMDKAEIEGGYNLSRYTSIVEDYSSAYEDYTEFFDNQWRKISYASDPVRYQEFIDMQCRTGL